LNGRLGIVEEVDVIEILFIKLDLSKILKIVCGLIEMLVIIIMMLLKEDIKISPKMIFKKKFNRNELLLLYLNYHYFIDIYYH
jgi:hypothetical protein